MFLSCTCFSKDVVQKRAQSNPDIEPEPVVEDSPEKKKRKSSIKKKTKRKSVKKLPAKTSESFHEAYQPVSETPKEWTAGAPESTDLTLTSSRTSDSEASPTKAAEPESCPTAPDASDVSAEPADPVDTAATVIPPAATSPAESRQEVDESEFCVKLLKAGFVVKKVGTIAMTMVDLWMNADGDQLRIGVKRSGNFKAVPVEDIVEILGSTNPDEALTTAGSSALLRRRSSVGSSFGRVASDADISDRETEDNKASEQAAVDAVVSSRAKGSKALRDFKIVTKNKTLSFRTELPSDRAKIVKCLNAILPETR